MITALFTGVALVWVLLPAQGDPASRGLGRWLDLQAGAVSARYRSIENSQGVQTTNQLQYGGQVRGRIKIDPGARLTLNANYVTGNNFIGSWNNTGVGTGAFAGRWNVKQLFVAWIPAAGVELSYGSTGFSRAINTEITTYDNDGYVIGERVSVRRPKELFFNELTVTRGYLGDLSSPSVFDRLDRLTGGRNYYQLIASKTMGAVSASSDYTRLSGVPHVRLAVTGRTPALRIVDTLRLEHYSRFGDDRASGFSLSVEKAINPRVTIGAGYADIDPRYQPINADRFGSGRRFYGTAAARLTTHLLAQLFLTQAVNNRFPITNRARIDVAVAYDVLGRLRRTTLFR